MKLKLHHVNLCTTDVPAMDEFYRAVLDMQVEPAMARQRITDQGYPGAVSFVSDGTTQFHIAERDLGIGFRTGQVVNPVQRGHIAFRTDDIAAFKKRLDDKGIKYSDYGGWGVRGGRPNFFFQPPPQVIEGRQAPPR